MSVLTDLTTTLETKVAEVDWTDASTPCRAYDPELWFAESCEQVALAQSLCGSCDLRVACLAGALERREPWGVWGGELFEHGTVVARKRRPGRPRKDDHLDRRAAELELRTRLSELVLELDDAVIPAQRDGAAA